MNENKPLILVVEDSPTQAVQLEYILSADDKCEVAVAGDGLQALAFLETRLPSMVITDIVMPNLDGYELCRRIKADPRSSQVPVVFLTSQTDQESIIQGIASGGDNFISKPYDPEFLLSRVQCLLISQSQDGEAAAESLRRYFETNRPPPSSGPEESLIEVFFPASGHDLHKEKELGLAISAIKKTLHRLNDSNADLQGKNLELEREIEHRKEVERSLEKARIAAESASRAKSIFLSSMSHELRTPLNAILGFAQILNHDQTANTQQRESISIILKSGQHLLTLINSVLDLAKIEAGKITAEPTNVDLLALVEQFASMLRIRAEAKGLDLVFDRSSTFPRFVRTDSVKLSQILVNLLGNAIKFTDRGKITIKLSVAEPRHGDDGFLLFFEIADTGSGIPPEEFSKLFKPFSQASTARGKEGTGLGLAIAKSYAELLGGSISVESTLGHGTTFRFSIRGQAVSAEDISAIPVFDTPVKAVGNAASYRILVVENNPDNRLFLVRLLGSFHFQLREAVNGHEAIAIARDWHPHLILMDRRLAGMDGLLATRAIRELNLPISPGIIAVTSQAYKEERQEMLEAGCDAFLHKPFMERELFDLMARHLDIRVDYAPAPLVSLTETKSEAPLTPESFASLPEELSIALESALADLDMEAVGVCIAQIRLQDPVLAAILKREADKFAYNDILALMKHTHGDRLPD